VTADLTGRVGAVALAAAAGGAAGAGQWGGAAFLALVTVGWTFGPELRRLEQRRAWPRPQRPDGNAPGDTMSPAVTHSTVEDGFGSAWERCGPGCDLHIVRPGKAQCSCGPQAKEGERG
jgi:hypothetical protein